MPMARGFNALPVELCLSISSFSDRDPKTISRVSRICKRNYKIYTPILYFKVDASALPTLALSPSQRAPLRSLHPASFVKKLLLKYRAPDDDPTGCHLEIFRRDCVSALNNIIDFASQAGNTATLKTFFLECPLLPLTAVCSGINLGVFGSLVDLALECNSEFSDETLQILNSMLVPTLRTLKFSSTPEDDICFLDLLARHHFMQFLQTIAYSCPNLTTLHLDIPNSAGDCLPINNVLSNMNFPALRTLHLKYGGMQTENDPDCLPFLSSHPHIQELSYFALPELPHPARSLVPNITSFSGRVNDFIALSLGHRPITQLEIRLPNRRLHLHRYEDELISALMRIPTLERLSLLEDDEVWKRSADSGLDDSGAKYILRACPKLTHFAFALNVRYKTALVGGRSSISSTVTRVLLNDFLLFFRSPQPRMLFAISHEVTQLTTLEIHLFEPNLLRKYSAIIHDQQACRERMLQHYRDQLASYLLPVLSSSLEEVKILMYDWKREGGRPFCLLSLIV